MSCGSSQVLDDGAQDRCFGLPQPRTGGDTYAQGGDLVGWVAWVGEPGGGGLVALCHGSPDEFGEHFVLVTEVEVEAPPGDTCLSEDVSDAEFAVSAGVEQDCGRRQDGLAEFRRTFVGGGGPPAAAAYGLGAAGCGRRHDRARYQTPCIDKLYSRPMGTLTSHIVVRDPDAAGSWYASVLGARENSGSPCQVGRC